MGVYYWLGKLGGVLKVPRKTHAKKDAAQAAEFQRTLCDKLRSLNVAGGKPVRIWVADEHRYGLIPVVRKCWTLRGVRPTAPYQTKYEWGYLYSALEVDGENEAEFLCLPGVNLELSGLFLEQLAASDPQPSMSSSGIRRGFIPIRNCTPCPRACIWCRCRPTVRNSTRRGHRRRDQGSDCQHAVEDA